MIHTVCTIYDIKAQLYSPPMYFASKGMGIRGFQDEVNRSAQDNVYYRHPDDFVLYLLGHFDDNSGKFVLCEVPELLIAGSDARVLEPG